METITSVIWISAIGIYLLIMFLFLFLWFQFNEMKKNYWSNRQINEIELIKPINLEPRPSKDGLRTKPKYRSDEQLFEFEQNPAKK